MSQERIKALFEQRGTLITAARALDQTAADEKRLMTAEERVQFDTMMDESDKVADEARRLERLMEAERRAQEINTPIIGRQGSGTGDNVEAPEVEYRSHGRVLKFGGTPKTTKESRSGMGAFFRGGIQVMNEVERRALQADTDNLGGYLRPDQQFVAQLIQAVDNQVFMRRNGTVIQMVQAEALGAPSLDADVSDADWTTELAVGTEDTAMRFGTRELRPVPLAKFIKVSNKLLRSSAIDIESLVRERLAYKLAVPQEKAYLTGTGGAGLPLGVFVADAAGIPVSRDVVAGTATAITADGLINAKYNQKAAYWPRSRWLFHRDTIRNIRLLKDTTTQYLWAPGLTGGQPDTILDSPFDVSEYAPNTFTTGLYVGLYGDFSYYWIAEALTFQLQRLVELFALTNQTGFVVRAEVDGMPVLAEAFTRLKLA